MHVSIANTYVGWPRVNYVIFLSCARVSAASGPLAFYISRYGKTRVIHLFIPYHLRFTSFSVVFVLFSRDGDGCILLTNN